MLARAHAVPVNSPNGAQPSRKNMSSGERMMMVLFRTSTMASKRAPNKAEVEATSPRLQ